MSEWIDIVVYAGLIVAVWGWLPAWSSRLTIPVIADRNPDWIADHPEIERRLAESRWFRWSCLLWGAVSLFALLAFQVGIWPQQLAFLRVPPKWEALKDLNSALFIVGLVYVAGCAALFCRWLNTNVPLSSTPPGDARTPVLARLRSGGAAVRGLRGNRRPPRHVGRRLASPGVTRHPPSREDWRSSSPFLACSCCS